MKTIVVVSPKMVTTYQMPEDVFNLIVLGLNNQNVARLFGKPTVRKIVDIFPQQIKDGIIIVEKQK